MGHYDFLYEDVTTEEIVEVIEFKTIKLKRLKTENDELEIDLKNISGKFSMKVIGNQIKKNEEEMESIKKSVLRIENLLVLKKQGKTISYMELN